MLKLRLLMPGLRGHLQQPLRLMLILFGVALGSALCTFILLINSATAKSLEHSINDLAGETDLTVTALGGESFGEQIFDQVLRVEGVQNAVPLIQNKAFIYLKDGSHAAMTLLGVDLLNDGSVRAGEKDGERLVADPLTFMASPDSVALTKSFSNKNDIHIQDRIKIVTALGVREFQVRALLDETGPGKAFGGTVAVMDIEASRLAFGKSGKMDQINIRVADRATLELTLSRLQEKLGDSFSVEPPSTQLQSLRDVVAPFEKILYFLGALAFLMAFFLVFNTASLSLAMRRNQLGILRALGIERARLILLILIEYGTIGWVGSAIGSFFAWGITVTFTDSIQRGFSSQSQAALPMTRDMMSLQTPLSVLALGTLATSFAVLIPVWKISRVSPAEAVISQKASSAPHWTGAGAVGLARKILLMTGFVGLAMLLMPLEKSNRITQLAPLVGALLLAPVLATALLSRMHRFLPAQTPTLLRLAWGYAVDKPKRVEATIRGLAVGMLLIFVIASIQDGFMTALSSMFINTARPDFYVSSNGDFISPMTLQPIDDRLQVELAKVDGVSGAYGQRIVSVQYESRKIKMNAFDEVPPTTLVTPYSYFEVVDRPVAEAGRDLYHGPTNAVMVSESFKSLYGKKTGDVINIRVLDHLLPFEIVGVTRDFTAGGGRIYISRDRYKALWHDPLVTGIAIVLKKSSELTQVKEAIEKRFGPSHGLIVTIDRGIKKDVEGILKQSFLTFYFIEIVCMLVAALGFISTFLIEIQSRTIELATLRALGMSAREMTAFLGIEACLLGFGASLVTLLLAIPVAWGLIEHTLPVVLGWVIGFHFNRSIFLMSLLLGIGISIFSAIFAIRWARTVQISEASQND